MKQYKKLFFLYLTAILMILLFVLLSDGYLKNSDSKPTYSDLIQMIKNPEMKDTIKIYVQSDADGVGVGKAYVEFLDKKETYMVPLPSVATFMDELKENNFLNYDTKTPPKTGWLSSYLPSLVLMFVGAFLFIYIFQQMQGGGGSKAMSFGKSKAKLIHESKVNFSDVAGLVEEKAELEELVDFLRNPKKYKDVGARIPKGVLLEGPPGTGKTLLAKAVAGEAGVPFFSISGSDFVELYVGVGASRVRDLFDQAKRNAPCIIFIDEIDAVGRRRGAGLGGGHDEREQTLNQLLVEMDGFGVNEGVIIIAATNRSDILDPAILRAGRFDRRVIVNKPDVRGREEILQVHAKEKPLKKDVNLKVIAQTTAGFTGADLENLLNEAALMAAKKNEKEVGMEDLKAAFIKIGIGTEKKSKVISEKEKRNTAYHEAGHAILFEYCEDLDPVHSISIIPTGWAGGYTMPLPGEDKMYLTKSYMLQDIIAFLGGRAAEEIILHDFTTGASNDIERATALARNMVTRYGMSDVLGPVQFGDDQEKIFLGKDFANSKNYSEEIASIIDQEISKLLKDSYKKAKNIIAENIELLHKTSELLIQEEKISGDVFRELIRKYGKFTVKHRISEGINLSPMNSDGEKA